MGLRPRPGGAAGAGGVDAVYIATPPSLHASHALLCIEAGIPVLSPLAWQLAYQYPVHRIGPDFLPDQPGETPTFLVVYRDRQDEVGFLEVNPVTKRLLELIEANSDASGRKLLLRIAAELSHPQPEVVISGGSEILQDLRNKHIISGTRLR